MNIFIVGAMGQLGRELVDCFRRGKTPLGVPDILKGKNTLMLADRDEVDIADPSSLLAYTRDKSIDLIINCAAYTNVNKCESERELAFKVNAVGPRNLAIACDKIGANNARRTL